MGYLVYNDLVLQQLKDAKKLTSDNSFCFYGWIYVKLAEDGYFQNLWILDLPSLNIRRFK
jgi:hypothetical protein